MKKQTKAMLMAVTMAASAMTACVPKATTETTAATEVAGTAAVDGGCIRLLRPEEGVDVEVSLFA